MVGLQKGYIVLVSVLIIGAAAVAIGTTLLITGADAARGILIEQQGTQSRSLATYCANEALQKIHDNIAFSGGTTVSPGGGSCTYTVTVLTGTTRSFTASGTMNNVVRKLSVNVTIGASTISVTSWQETP